MNEFSVITEAVLKDIKKKESEIIFDLWYKDMEIVSITDRLAVIEVKNNLTKTILQKPEHYDILRESLNTIGMTMAFELKAKEDTKKQEDKKENTYIPDNSYKSSEKKGEDEEVEVIQNDELLEKYERDKRNEVFSSPKIMLEEDDNEDITAKISEPTIISKYTFSNFVVGDSNNFAFAACFAVAKGDGMMKCDGRAYNPLFIWGPSGLGKTHLLCAITNEIKKNNIKAKIVYKKGDEFTNELIESIQRGDVFSFKNKYRKVDVLLIDDVQFIAGKESTQEEFFNTFTALYESEKQIILTSDRPPRAINRLEERLRTRFEWGLIADIQPPSFELRTAIIKQKSEELGIKFTPEMIDYLADQLRSNVRQIEGAIKKIYMMLNLTSVPLTMDLCKRSIADFLYGGKVPDEVICDKILRIVADKCSVSVEDIKSTKRNEKITKARHISIYIMRELTDMKLTDIGDVINRDHSTVVSSLNKTKEDIKTNKVLDAEIKQMISIIRN